MQKFTSSIRFRSLFFSSKSHHCHLVPCKRLLAFTTSIITPSYRAYSSTPCLEIRNSALVNYLVDSLKFSKHKAQEVASRFPDTKSVQNPEAVVHVFKEIGLSDAQIKSVAQVIPSVLFMNVEKTLKPKVMFLQGLGLSKTYLGAVISKNPTVLSCSLERSLKPCIGIILKILKNDQSNRSPERVNDDLFKIVTRCNRIVNMKSTIESNVAYLESCGIIGSQLSVLLVRQPRIFTTRESKVMEVVSRALDMGFVMGSRMLFHGVLSCSQTNPAALDKKYVLFQSFGFSKDEWNEIYRKAPAVLGLSEAKIRYRIEFFLHNLMLDKSVIVRCPFCLSVSMEKRVIPRYRVMEMIKSRKLLKREPHISQILAVTDENFVEKYILSFVHDAEDLMAAYKGRLLEC